MRTLMKSLRRLLFSNWRNKFISLFFAVSIWTVAYQSEKRETEGTVRVGFRPLDLTKMSVLALEVLQADGSYRPWSGELTLVVEGPRKQIEAVESQLRSQQVVTVDIAPDKELHAFQASDFAFLPRSVEVASLRPDTVRVVQERIVERVVDDLEDRILVSGYVEDRVVSKEVIRPESGVLRLRGPASLVESLPVNLQVNLNSPPDNSLVEVRPTFGTGPRNRGARSSGNRILSNQRELIESHVEIRDEETQRWVSLEDPPVIVVRIAVETRRAEYSKDAVDLDFLLPLTRRGYRVILNDVPPGSNSIPVKFTGPQSRIEALKKEPRLSLTVRAPPNFDVENGGTYTFTEDVLLLHGYEDIKISQHASRAAEGQNSWSYEVIAYSIEGTGG